MASALYPKGKQGLLDGSIDWDTDNFIVWLMDLASYTYNSTHSLSAHASAGSVASVSVTGKSATDGIADGADCTFSGVTGNPCEALILMDAGNNRLLAYIDGFTVTPNTGDIEVQWDSGANKIFAL